VSKAGERGAALLELAMVTPLLLLLIFGVADFGRALYTNIAIRDAAQEGVRYAARNPGQATDTVNRVIASTDRPSLTPANVAVTCLGASSPAIEVSVTYDLALITPLAGVFGGKLILQAAERSTIFAEGACVGT